MSLPKPDLHIRVSHECKAALALLAEVEQAPEAVVAARYLEELIRSRPAIEPAGNRGDGGGRVTNPTRGQPYPLGSVVVGYTLLDFTPGADLPEEVLDWCRLPAGLMRDPWGNPWLS